MGEKEFQQEVIDRLARIETKQDATMKTVEEHSKVIANHSERITANEQSTKSAHHRITGLIWAAGSLGAAAGTAANFVASLWKSGGHGP